jgi:hypothetical protein
VKVAEDMLSPYPKKLLEDLDLKGTSTEKLIPNLNAEKNYVVHYRNLSEISSTLKLSISWSSNHLNPSTGSA